MWQQSLTNQSDCDKGGPGVLQTANVRRAYSTSRSPVTAAREMLSGLFQPDLQLVVVFCTAAFDLDRLGREIAVCFGETPVIGCTTAGEITPIGYMEGVISGFSMAGSGFTVVTDLIPDISNLQIPRGFAVVDRLIAAFAERGRAIDPRDTFAMLLIDGMCSTEEAVLTSLHRRLDPIVLFGGSAGDDMRLEKTFVLHGGRFHCDAAVLTLVQTSHRFRVFRRQHFSPTNTRMVVTGADPIRRVVTEIDAEPAGPEYARIVGLDYHVLGPIVFAEFPVMVRVGGDYYVRSIQKANADRSLTFFSAIDEGLVLTLARRSDMVEDLRSFFHDIRAEMGQPMLVIAFDCVLRSLEAESRQIRNLASKILAENNVIGFSTYGEQLAAMHVNHTFTGVFISEEQGK
jgi:hypothetical protein